MTQHNYKTLFLFILALLLPTFVGMSVVDAFLKTPVTPYGIISFEFCGFTLSCQPALESWKNSGQIFAMLSLGLDYLFLVLYPALIATGLVLMTSKLTGTLAAINKMVVFSCVVISLCDAIENYALIQIILSQSEDSYGMIAAVFASIKFALLGIAVLWLLFIAIHHWLFSKK